MLKFYFSADRLEKGLNNLILKNALSSSRYNAEECADKIIRLIFAKQQLAELYAFIDVQLKRFDEAEVSVLRDYALMRGGISKICKNKRREIRRLIARFSRRAERGTARYLQALKYVGEYYCLL